MKFWAGECQRFSRQKNQCSIRLVNEFNLFILEVLKARTDPAQKHLKTILHHGRGAQAGRFREVNSQAPILAKLFANRKMAESVPEAGA